MTTQPNEILMQAWKQQVDGCLRTLDTLVEAAKKLREMQLEAPANADAEQCAAYWRRFYEIGAQMQARLAQCMVPAPMSVPAALEAYKQWLDTAQQLYKLPAMPS
jgi:hypothetical protein